MSEEKLYAVKNDLGEWADPCYTFGSGAWATPDKAEREKDAKHHGGHVVTLIEAPEKVVVSEDEAEILKKLDREIRTKSTGYSPWRLSKLDDLGMAVEDACKALTIGWVVEKPKRWNVKVPHTKDDWYYKAWNSDLRTISDKELRSEFTESEIEHYGLQDCEKEEVSDD